MSEGATQTLLRIARVAVVAVISVVLTNAADIIGLLPPEYQLWATLILIPALDGLAKAIGGPTEAASRSVGRGAAAAGFRRPSWLSV